MLFPVSKSKLQLSESQIKDETAFVAMLERMCRVGHLYFAYAWDLTNSMQRVYSADYRTPLWSRADNRFFWNRHVQSKLIDKVMSISSEHVDQDINHFILPVICGFVQITNANINNRSFMYSLISRKRIHRVGTRYHSRGINDEGHVSNYVETEQVVCFENPTETGAPLSEPRHMHNVVMSFVQMRGSIPLFWRQKANARYVPTLEVVTKPTTYEAFQKHTQETTQLYGGKQILVNLINKKGYELPLGQAFQGLITMLNDSSVRYTHFDFHQECRKMQYHNLDKLLHQHSDDLREQGYFHIAPDNSTSSGSRDAGIESINPILIRQQVGIIRTNCIDCLDRTNVVQSLFSRQVLNQQLREVNILRSAQENFSQHSSFEWSFKQIWADNADAVSILYSGTGALKTDFTRTGLRTKQGALRDGYNSIVRYVKNNFLDGSRQDAFDLFLGNYRIVPVSASASLVQTGELQMSPFTITNHFAIYLIGTAILATLLVISSTVLLARDHATIFRYTIIALILCTLIVRVVIGIYGSHLVDLPRLVQLDYIVEQKVSQNGTVKYSNIPVVTDVSTGVTTLLKEKKKIA